MKRYIVLFETKSGNITSMKVKAKNQKEAVKKIPTSQYIVHAITKLEKNYEER